MELWSAVSTPELAAWVINESPEGATAEEMSAEVSL